MRCHPTYYDSGAYDRKSWNSVPLFCFHSVTGRKIHYEENEKSLCFTKLSPQLLTQSLHNSQSAVLKNDIKFLNPGKTCVATDYAQCTWQKYFLFCHVCLALTESSAEKLQYKKQEKSLYFTKYIIIPAAITVVVNLISCCLFSCPALRKVQLLLAVWCSHRTSWKFTLLVAWTRCLIIAAWKIITWNGRKTKYFLYSIERLKVL